MYLPGNRETYVFYLSTTKPLPLHSKSYPPPPLPLPPLLQIFFFYLFETDQCNTQRNTTPVINSPTPRHFQLLVTPSPAHPEGEMDRCYFCCFSFSRCFSSTTFGFQRYKTRSRTDSNSTVQDGTDSYSDDNKEEDTRSSQTDEEEEDSKKDGEDAVDGVGLGEGGLDRIKKYTDRCRSK